MGIQGLLPQFKSIAREVHVSEYAGKTVAIDAYAWLHRGAFTCSKELVEGVATTKYIDYCMRNVMMLLHWGVRPLLVFDGAQLPAKRHTEIERHMAREDYRHRARMHLSQGNQQAAAECYQKAVDITPLIARGLMDALEEAGVAYLVAPYEADAQMAYMAHQGMVWALITEDSDLLAYYCPRVLYKLDRHTGLGQEICVADFPRNRDLNLTGFSRQQFLEMCIMSGCDFLPSLASIGIKKAYNAIRKHRTFTRACRVFRYDPSLTVPYKYEENFQRAIWTFLHQTVYCPHRKQLVPVTEIPPEGLVPATGVKLPVLRRPEAPSQPPNPPTEGEGSEGAGAGAGAGPSSSERAPGQEGGTAGASSGPVTLQAPPAFQPFLPPHQLPPSLDPLDFLGPLLPPEIATGIAEGRLDPMTWQPFPPRPPRGASQHGPGSQSQQQQQPSTGQGPPRGPVSREGAAGPGPQPGKGASQGKPSGSGAGAMRPITNFFESLPSTYGPLINKKEALRPFKPPSLKGSGPLPSATTTSQRPSSNKREEGEEVTSPPPSRPRPTLASKFFNAAANSDSDPPPSAPSGHASNPSPAPASDLQARLLKLQSARPATQPTPGPKLTFNPYRQEPPLKPAPTPAPAPAPPKPVSAFARKALEVFSFKPGANFVPPIRPSQRNAQPAAVASSLSPEDEAALRPPPRAPPPPEPFIQRQKDIDELYDALDSTPDRRHRHGTEEEDGGRREQMGGDPRTGPILPVSLVHLKGYARLASETLDQIERKVAGEQEQGGVTAPSGKGRKRVREPEPTPDPSSAAEGADDPEQQQQGGKGLLEGLSNGESQEDELFGPAAGKALSSRDTTTLFPLPRRPKLLDETEESSGGGLPWRKHPISDKARRPFQPPRPIGSSDSGAGHDGGMGSVGPALDLSRFAFQGGPAAAGKAPISNTAVTAAAASKGPRRGAAFLRR